MDEILKEYGLTFVVAMYSFWLGYKTGKSNKRD